MKRFIYPHTGTKDIHSFMLGASAIVVYMYVLLADTERTPPPPPPLSTLYVYERRLALELSASDTSVPMTV